ncbi:MAG: response regulator [Euryarchaeota archaeon]|nr:response regulator [Euryarchaeota archaeon]MBU4138460.1 response regulator [Euryarchaeota archaeon]
MTKVLVVEDNDTNLELVVELLTSCGFTVDTAVNGEEGVKKAENKVYDLIVMDIELPGMDGVDATRIIKSLPGYENTPTIALTAYAMKGDRERFLAAGFNEYIPKPIYIADFTKMLKKYKGI